MSYYYKFPINPKPKRIIRSLVFAVILFKKGDVWLISPHVTNIQDNYRVVVFDDNFKYQFEIENCTNLDVIMMHAMDNIYYYYEQLPF